MDGSGTVRQRIKKRKAIPLGRFPTVFQAEVFAILQCVEVLREERKVGKCITIFSDSQGAINTVGKPDISSILAWECKEALNQLTEENKVTLVWVPGHKDIRSNERADQLHQANNEKLGRAKP